MSVVYAGVDLGGTSIKAALAWPNGDVCEQRSIPTKSNRGPNDVIQRMGALIESMISSIGRDASLAGLGIGVPGLVDRQQGTTKFLPNLATQWRDVPVSSMLESQLGCPVKILNDVRTATLGELRWGHGRNDPQLTMAFFSIGTGVGGGIALRGDVWLGPLGAAGELGHQTIQPDGPRCGCGNRGCLEAIASGTAITAVGVRLMRSGLAPSLHAQVDGHADGVTPQAMGMAAQHDPLVREALIDAAEAIGIAAANVVTILHPQMIVLGGGVAEIGSLMTDTVREVIRTRVGMFPTDDIRVEKSMLGEHAGLRGAISLAMQSEVC